MAPSVRGDKGGPERSDHLRRPKAIVAVVVVLVAAAVAGILIYVTGNTSGPASTSSHSASATRFTTPAALTKARVSADDIARRNHCPINAQSRVNDMHWSSPPSMTINPNIKYTAAVTTTAGAFIITLDAQAAPQTVNNFIFLADQGYFHCNAFNLIVPGEADQTGDPAGTGEGGPGYVLPSENIPSRYPPGAVAMANTGGSPSGSQFFIVMPAGSAKLSPKYSLFGTVTSGIGVPELINLQGEGSAKDSAASSHIVERVINVKIREH